MFVVDVWLLPNYWHSYHNDTKVKCCDCVCLTYFFCGSLASCKELLHNFDVCYWLIDHGMMIYGGQFLWQKSCGWDKAYIDHIRYTCVHDSYAALFSWGSSAWTRVITGPFLWTCKSGSVSYVSVDWSCIYQFLSGWLNLSCSMGLFLHHDATNCIAHGATVHTRQ